MSLRTRLLLAFGYLVMLLVLSSTSAAVGFYRLSRGIDVILAENFASVQAATAMLGSLERQDSATLARLLDASAKQGDLDTAQQDFDEALARARANITLEQERPLIDRIDRAYRKYLAEREILFAAQPAKPLAAYQASTFPAFETTKQVVLLLLEANHEAMREADRGAKRSAVRSGVWLGALVFVALISLVFLSRAMQRGLLQRLSELQVATEAIARGDPLRRLPEGFSDELGSISKRLNEALDAQVSLHKKMEGLVSQKNQLVLGLMGAQPAGSALFDLDGTQLTPALSLDRQADLDGVSDWIRTVGKRDRHTQMLDRSAAAVTAGTPQEPFQVQLLVAGERRPVAWLAVPTQPSVGRPASNQATSS
jgi:methyl-accepting chemotaxis protein-2 (aspartate sensor receptor)